MALPTATQLQGMDWAWRGEPFVFVPSKSSITLATMDWAWNGEPFVANDYAAGGPPAGALYLASDGTITQTETSGRMLSWNGNYLQASASPSKPLVWQDLYMREV